jgi:hypothetical protein
MAVEIDDAIDRLLGAMEARGFPVVVDPIGDDQLADLSAAIAPLQLPNDLVTVWRRLPAGAGAFLNGLDLLAPEVALGYWREDLAQGTYPRSLLPIGYSSRFYCWIDLQTPSEDLGGAIWEGHLELSEVHLVAPSIAQLLDASSEAWGTGIIRWSEWHGRAVAVLEEPDEWAALRARRWPDRVTIPIWTPDAWPARWRESSALDLQEIEPRGATTTIREMRETAAGHGVERSFTLVGRIGGGLALPEGYRTELEDSSGRIEVWVPAASDPFHLVFSGALVELDVILRSVSQPHEPIDRVHARATDGLGTDASRDPALIQALIGIIDFSSVEAIAIAARRTSAST